MPRGILELLGLAGTLVVALPAAALGVEYLVGGRPATGAALVALAALVVWLSRRARTPEDAVGGAAERVAGAVTKEPDEEE